MTFSIPMLIPMIVGVVIGVTCRRLYAKICERTADQQANSLFQVHQQGVEERRASPRPNMGTVESAFVDNHDEILRG